MKGDTPIVAIVGRPNVGKSTLFNRIIGRREAIVDPSEGVTRDRKYGEASWTGRKFTVVDTGGYDAVSKDLILKSIRQQAETALEEAELVLFMVDVTTGITEADDMVARKLRREPRKVILVVNKVDNEKRESELHEFFKLGLGEPYPVSAESGRKAGDLLDVLLEFIPGEEEEGNEDKDGIRIAVVGVPNVGKSSIVNRLLGDERQIVAEKPGTTRDSTDSQLVHEAQSYTLIDTAGIRRRTRVKESLEFYSVLRAKRSIARSDVSVIILDAVRGLTKQDAQVIIEVIKRNKGLVCAVNKWDLIQKDTRTAGEYTLDLYESLPLLVDYPLIFVSALTGQRVFKILSLVTEVFEEMHKKVKTSTINRWLGEVVSRNSPPNVKGKFIKLLYAAQVDTAPPIFTLFSNEPKLIPQNYRRYLETQLRESFGFKGVPLTLSFRKK